MLAVLSSLRLEVLSAFDLIRLLLGWGYTEDDCAKLQRRHQTLKLLIGIFLIAVASLMLAATAGLGVGARVGGVAIGLLWVGSFILAICLLLAPLAIWYHTLKINQTEQQNRALLAEISARMNRLIEISTQAAENQELLAQLIAGDTDAPGKMNAGLRRIKHPTVKPRR